MSLSRLSRPLILSLCLLGFSACSTSGSKEDEYVERPAQEIYQEAQKELEDRRYTKAADLFDEVERQHPYSQWAIKGQIESAKANYKALKYDDAIFTLDRFIQLHPANEMIDYAYYLKALCYYEQISTVDRDQRMTQLAMQSLQEVIRRFPDSSYARDAQYKVSLTENHLAGKEMAVGRYYLKRGSYAAAINRFKNVIEHYQTTNQVPEALHRLTESYLALGLTDEAKKMAAILGHNYPGSDWYSDSYALLVDENFTRDDLKENWLTDLWDRSK